MSIILITYKSDDPDTCLISINSIWDLNTPQLHATCYNNFIPHSPIGYTPNRDIRIEEVWSDVILTNNSPK